MVTARAALVIRTVVLLMAMVTPPLFAGKDKTKAPEATGDWLPIDPQELAMRDLPESPGVAAAILFRENSSDDRTGVSSYYYRIKILKEEGRKYADVIVPFEKNWSTVRDIRARTIEPDGKTVDFDGKVYENTVAKHKELQNLAKTFTLPDVRVGSVIEYRYKIQHAALSQMDSFALYFFSLLGSAGARDWVIPDELFTRRARFLFRPAPGLNLMWTWTGLPSEKQPHEEGGTVSLDLQNIPAFEKEEYSPPETVIKAGVHFFYIFSNSKEYDPKSTDWFWKDFDKSMDKRLEDFIGKRKSVEREVSRLIQPGDSPETKLQRIYARAQQIRNLDYEAEKTEKELQRDKSKVNDSVEDVLRRGYGTSIDVNTLFLAMARAAGLEAHLVMSSSRDRGFFSPNVPDRSQLGRSVVEVKVGSGFRYFSPSTLYCPYGLLPWEVTGVRAMRVQRDEGEFLTLPNPAPTEAKIERTASLELDPDGSARGKVVVDYSGRESLLRRRYYREEDAAGRRKGLEEEVKGWLPPGSAAELMNQPEWEKAEQSLRAEFEIKVPNAATIAGHRMLLPLTVFQGGSKYPFQSARRVYPVYFDYPFEAVDAVTILLPAGCRIEQLPAASTEKSDYALYEVSRASDNATLQLRRRIVMEGIYFRPDQYFLLQSFYQKVRAGDEQQVVLATGSAK